MKYYIIDPDFKSYVYVCDIEQTHLVFAIPKGLEFEKFQNYHCEYTFDNLDRMPETYTIKVLKLAEIGKDTYKLNDHFSVEYLARKIYIIYPAHIQQ